MFHNHAEDWHTYHVFVTSEYNYTLFSYFFIKVVQMEQMTFFCLQSEWVVKMGKTRETSYFSPQNHCWEIHAFENIVDKYNVEHLCTPWGMG